MRRIILITLLFISTGLATKAQDRYLTRNAKIKFLSEAPMEKIEAVNTQGTSMLDSKTGAMEFAVLIKAFEFEKALMEEHFNENYMESGKFPKSTFKGTVTDISTVDFTKDGTYPVKIKGQLTIHGVAKDVATSGTLEVKGGKITGNSEFDVALADYNISVPGIVRDKIAKTVHIIVEAAYQKM